MHDDGAILVLEFPQSFNMQNGLQRATFCTFKHKKLLEYKVQKNNHSLLTIVHIHFHCLLLDIEITASV